MQPLGRQGGQKVGIVGFGGLGDMAAKLAIAMGAEVVLFTTDQEKLAEATQLGATGVLGRPSRTRPTRTTPTSTLDFILSTVPEKTDLNPFIPLLKRNATMVVVGALEPLSPVNNMQTAMHRQSVAGSLIGTIAETQDVLDFCAEHNIAPDIQVIPIQEYQRRLQEGHRRRSPLPLRHRHVHPETASHRKSQLT